MTLRTLQALRQCLPKWIRIAGALTPVPAASATHATRIPPPLLSLTFRSSSSFPLHSHSSITSNEWHGTTVLAVRRADQVCVVGDGQVSLGQTVLKPNARKVRRLGEAVVAGFSGTTADAITLFERLEAKLEAYPNQLLRASVELAKDWRQDKALRRLDALLLVADRSITLTLTGNGDVLEPSDGAMAIGSGGMYALAAARALMDLDGWSAERIARRAMQIAADICVYTNDQLTCEVLTGGVMRSNVAPRPTSPEGGA
ncbi:hypothetical protein CDCA_CDCA08G2519 [Cyanidium caldarium]|uniref:ATP-dependent protease subunit HslV n=1 Tax=Cyanidium caldarium TaxID=2771 RepID=A0AAV9IWJ5_CYACA|nr:hypothetical protein CDCA_CDCA08G2519 [Cyanidium caldarium]